MSYVLWFVSSVLIGLACAYIAKKKGKNPVGWFFVGALMNLLVLLVVNEILKKKQVNQQ